MPAPGVDARDHVEAWLIDSPDPDSNPNLDFVLADIASAVAGLRAENCRVLVHCVAAELRTPSAAIAYSRRQGVPTQQAVAEVVQVLPGARAGGSIWAAAMDVPPAHGAAA